MSYPDQKRLACGSKEFDPLFPFPPGGSRGGDGSPLRLARGRIHLKEHLPECWPAR
jgi:hypothetical protein